MIGLDVKIDVADALRILDKIDDPALVRKIAEAVADEDVKPALAKYPPRSGKKMQWASDAQRRGFFARLRAGAITVPYQRTGDYGRSFQKQPISNGIALVSGLAYAPYVRGPGQAAYHKGNWTTLDELAQSLEADAALTATGVIVDEIGA